jgi:hypothetical protein
MRYLRTLSDVVSARSLARVTPGSFLASAHQEMSEALVQSQGYVYHICALLLAKATGRTVLPGADVPYLYEALRCVCRVCVLVATSFCTTKCCSRCIRFFVLGFHPFNSFCFLSAPLLIVTASQVRQHPHQLQTQEGD